MRLPKKIKIGPNTYKVIKQSKILKPKGNDGKRHYGRIGQVCANTEVIQVVDWLKGSEKEANVWHEIVHAIENELGIHSDERHVEMIARLLVQILKDNPSVVPDPR